MADLPSTCVVDASVLLDLHAGNIVAPFFRLPYRFVAPDVIVAELHEPDGSIFLTHGLHKGELDGTHVALVFALRQRYHYTSVADLFAPVMAHHLGATLLTGDRALRAAAHAEGISVRGTLWVLDEMIRSAVLPPADAAQALRFMLAQDSRLPADECARRFAAWER